MARAPLLLLLVLVLVLVALPGAALRCYACAPIDTSKLPLVTRVALTPFPLCDQFKPRRPQERFIMKCPPLSNACLKTDTLRMCFVSLRKKERCKDGRCTCLTELCNAAHRAAAGWRAPASLLAAAALLWAAL